MSGFTPQNTLRWPVVSRSFCVSVGYGRSHASVARLIHLSSRWRSASRLPVVVDVSHAAGRRDILAEMTAAAFAAGAEAVMIGAS